VRRGGGGRAGRGRGGELFPAERVQEHGVLLHRLVAAVLRLADDPVAAAAASRVYVVVVPAIGRVAPIVLVLVVDPRGRQFVVELGRGRLTVVIDDGIGRVLLPWGEAEYRSHCWMSKIRSFLLISLTDLIDPFFSHIF
jgi:hypothetical protein